MNQIDIKWKKKKSICVVLCSKGYPETYKKNILIQNIDKLNLDKENLCFHAGTIKKDNKIFANGGRVLNFVSLSDDFLKARKNIIDNIQTLKWKDGFFRKDIGYKVIDQ